MADSVAETPNQDGPDLSAIHRQVLSAAQEMFDRAISSAPEDAKITDDSILVEDDKSDLPNFGPLQDCEFGMILVLVREWCHRLGIKGEFFDNQRFDQATLVLVKRVVDRTLQVDAPKARVDEGGESKQRVEGNRSAFFTAEPYTEHKRDPRQRIFKYSANIDAAMITVAFLAPALKQYNDALAKLEYGVPGLPPWVTTLRDACLYLVQEGLYYALDCQILVGNKCQGFTCDPHTRDEYPADGGFTAERENDRLFFTWTACETIKDIVLWRDTYLENVQSPLLPEPAVAELKPLIKQLEDALSETATWCRSYFFKRFEEFVVPKTKATQDLVDAGGTADKEEEVNQMERDVLHVYHLSQYAAIRSLALEGVTLDETLTIVNKLDSLVREAIMDSGLDKSKDEALFRTLTRNYWLGTSNPLTYRDDAWYPLVVRSLSGLLSRTLQGFERRYRRSDIETVINAFEDSLNRHLEDLLIRRPDGGSDGPDGKLWSFAIDQPYVLYATQRTIFALMTYGDFLVEVARFRTGGIIETGDLRQDLALRVARRFSETLFLPIIDELLARTAPETRPGPPPPANHGPEVPLPTESWAADAIRNRFARIAEDFNTSRVAQALQQKTNNLILVRDTVEDPSLPDNLSAAQERALKLTKNRFEEILRFDGVGEKLVTWEPAAVTGVLFEYLLQEYLKMPNGSFSDLLKNTELLKLIEKAKTDQDNFKKA